VLILKSFKWLRINTCGSVDSKGFMEVGCLQGRKREERGAGLQRLEVRGFRLEGKNKDGPGPDKLATADSDLRGILRQRGMNSGAAYK
jgi:hypothetical protein